MDIVRVVDFPFEVPDSGTTLRFEVCGFGVRTGDRRVVVDPWLAFDAKRAEPDAADRWARIAASLDAADVAPARVDVVVFTHLDGVGWAVGPDGETPCFPNARHLVPVGELDAYDEGRRGATEAVDVLRSLGLVDEVAAPYELAPGVTVEPVGGHTRSNTAVRAGDALFVGHLFLHPAQVRAFERIQGDEDPEGTVAARRRILDDAVESGTVLYGDLWDSPGRGTVQRDGDGYRLVTA